MRRWLVLPVLLLWLRARITRGGCRSQMSLLRRDLSLIGLGLLCLKMMLERHRMACRRADKRSLLLRLLLLLLL